MGDAAIKHTRRVLRQVSTHLTEANRRLGAMQESWGLVDVMYHPEKNLPHLNYVAPRQKTAWIPAAEIEKGLDVLRQRERLPRVHYIEGLFPPLFARSLLELGLTVERDVPIMTRTITDEVAYRLPDHTRIEEASTHEGIALWWYVWRNAYFDVVTRGAEPVAIGETMREITLNRQTDLILYQHNFPIGVARLTFHNETAHIAALAIMKEARVPALVRSLYEATLHTAHRRECSLVFISGAAEMDRHLCRELGFVDMGSLVCYAATRKENNDERQSSLFIVN